jgi:hypothetical protein
MEIVQCEMFISRSASDDMYGLDEEACLQRENPWEGRDSEGLTSLLATSTTPRLTFSTIRSSIEAPSGNECLRSIRGWRNRAKEVVVCGGVVGADFNPYQRNETECDHTSTTSVEGTLS